MIALIHYGEGVGKCEAACPQKIAISNDLECVLKDFEPIVGK